MKETNDMKQVNDSKTASNETELDYTLIRNVALFVVFCIFLANYDFGDSKQHHHNLRVLDQHPINHSNSDFDSYKFQECKELKDLCDYSDDYDVCDIETLADTCGKYL
jgi:hypothetical protein